MSGLKETILIPNSNLASMGKAGRQEAVHDVPNAETNHSHVQAKSGRLRSPPRPSVCSWNKVKIWPSKAERGRRRRKYPGCRPSVTSAPGDRRRNDVPPGGEVEENIPAGCRSASNMLLAVGMPARQAVGGSLE
ncbi:hypothetical protein HPP92_029015 [Vanilla planifolia]|uniref:Uncharacterized protein n=1 Tax=Vanilla planifolia TaxID=51239 RepID=A0A835P3U0_VANPL|nr:hypothetical protein HPP92_029003 [Vanilla planifolia]KAG0446083.1 hypothetical protein HPP92_029015 [Vanilla planifolia]